MPERPPAVLHVMRMSGVSGSENHLAVLAEEQVHLGWTVDVVIPTPRATELPSPFLDRLRRVCRDVRIVPMAADLSPRLAGALAGALHRRRYAVAHAHLIHAEWHLAVAVAADPGVALVVSKHNHDPFWRNPAVRLMQRASLRRARAVIAISASLAGYVREVSGVQPDVVRYGLPPGPPPRHDGRDPLRLLAVGRLEPQKGLDVLLRAMPAILAAEPGARLQVAGDGSRRDALAAQAEALGVAPAIDWLGRREDVDALMAGAGMLVHPARWEGFGLVLLEAMRSALAVVASRTAAIPEVVDDGVTGLLVEPEDADGLAAAATSLLAEPARARALGAAGRRRLEERFSPARMGRETIAVYERARAA
jgi:glycosyltransferase involved in cell wall biosynthesis